MVLLAGGRDKHLPWGEMAALTQRKVRHLILFGEAAGLIERAMQAAGKAEQVCEIHQAGTLEGAVELAAQLAQPGDVVLLSPGGTSFDAYRDFVARGEHFRQLVKALESRMNRKPSTEPSGSIDWILLAAVAALVALGLMMVYSSTFDMGYREYGDSAFFLKRQLTWLAIGVMAMVVAARLRYQHWMKLSLVIMGAALLLLVILVILGRGRHLLRQFDLTGGAGQAGDRDLYQPLVSVQGGAAAPTALRLAAVHDHRRRGGRVGDGSTRPVRGAGDRADVGGDVLRGRR